MFSPRPSAGVVFAIFTRVAPNLRTGEPGHTGRTWVNGFLLALLEILEAIFLATCTDRDPCGSNPDDDGTSSCFMKVHQRGATQFGEVLRTIRSAVEVGCLAPQQQAPGAMGRNGFPKARWTQQVLGSFGFRFQHFLRTPDVPMCQVAKLKHARTSGSHFGHPGNQGPSNWSSLSFTADGRKSAKRGKAH